MERRCSKKRHGHNFDFWALKRIARLNFIVENTFYSFQVSKIKIVAVSFFFNTAYFRWRSQNFKVCWLWAATPLRKVARPKSTSFSESPGRGLSHGGTLDMGSNTKDSSKLPKSKKRRFLPFFCCHFVKNFKCRQSDNFDPRRSVYGSSESLCPKFSETPLRK